MRLKATKASGWKLFDQIAILTRINFNAQLMQVVSIVVVLIPIVILKLNKP